MLDLNSSADHKGDDLHATLIFMRQRQTESVAVAVTVALLIMFNISQPQGLSSRVYKLIRYMWVSVAPQGCSF